MPGDEQEDLDARALDRLSEALGSGRFVHHQGIRLLYDRANGIEHRLNQTANELVGKSLARSGTEIIQAIASLAEYWEQPAPRIRDDLHHLWRQILEPERPLPVRKSGAPEEWSEYDHAFPLALEIELTKICNWRCDFCYNVFKVFDNFEPVTQGRHLPLDAVDLVMAEAYESGCLRLRFSGGDPTLHPDFDRIIGSGGSYGFDMELFTNGSRITPARADYLASNRLRVMLVSLHGNAATHNRLADHQRAHEQSLRAMSLAVERGITVIAEALLFADNAGEMLDVAQRVADLGVKDLSLMPYVPFGPADPRRPIPGRQVANLVDTLKLRGPAGMRYRVPCAPRHCLSSEPSPIDTPVAEEFDNHCGAGLLWASVSYDGRFRHCPHSNVYAGHVADGVGKLWRERMRPRIRGIIAEAEATCGGCSQFGACKGGCHLSLVQSYEEVAQ